MATTQEFLREEHAQDLASLLDTLEPTRKNP